MIETERLRLRPIIHEDKGWISEQAADAEVMKMLGGPQSRAACDARMDYFMRLHRDHGLGFSVMERREDGAFLGLCGLKFVDNPGAGDLLGAHEIGWRLSQAYWGQGYAREAASAWLDAAFGRVGATRVVAITSERNRASWGLMRRLGMTRAPEDDFVDGRFPPEDNPAIVHAITADMWRRT